MLTLTENVMTREQQAEVVRYNLQMLIPAYLPSLLQTVPVMLKPLMAGFQNSFLSSVEKLSVDDLLLHRDNIRELVNQIDDPKPLIDAIERARHISRSDGNG